MNFSTDPDLDELIALVSKLPGLGPKSSRRIALYLLKNRENVMKPLSKSLEKVHAKIIRCNLCGNIKSKEVKCDIKKCSLFS